MYWYYGTIAAMVLILLWRMYKGYKVGMVREIISVVATLCGGFCALLLLAVVNSYRQHELGRMFQTVFLLGVLLVVYRFVSVILNSMKLVSGLPVIKLVNKVAGILIGIAEGGILNIFFLYLLKMWGLSVLAG